MSDLADIIEALSEPRVYPEPTTRVEVTQTQMSVVFLTDAFVYKVKKPVNLGYLDYTTLAKRRHLCRQEVTLNRRLCPEVYIGAVPIRRTPFGIVPGGNGKTMEYAVKMRRLPQDRMMDVLLAQDKVTPEMVTRVAEKIAEFHRHAASNPAIREFGSIDTLRFNTEENFSQAEKYIGRAVDPEQYHRIAHFTRDFLQDRALLFHKRVLDRRIKDCHGDLHTQHICFTQIPLNPPFSKGEDYGICIYDCIEFNDRFRYVDVAAEVSFLAMDLDRWGHAGLSRHLVDAYVRASGDSEIPELLGYYKCYFAVVRAKVNCFRLDDPLLSAEQKAQALADARKYFELAESYIM